MGAWELVPQGHTPYQTPSLASHHPGVPVSPIAFISVDIPFAHRPRAEVQALRRLTCCLYLSFGVPGGLEPTASAAGSPALERESIRKLVPQLCISNPGTMPPLHSAEHRQETKGKSKPSHQHRKSVGVRGSYSRAGGQVNTVAPPCG